MRPVKHQGALLSAPSRTKVRIFTPFSEKNISNVFYKVNSKWSVHFLYVRVVLNFSVCFRISTLFTTQHVEKCVSECQPEQNEQWKHNAVMEPVCSLQA